MSTIYIYKDKAGEYRWRLKSRNGRILADSGEGYKKFSRCITMAEQVLNVAIIPGGDTAGGNHSRGFKVKWQIA